MSGRRAEVELPVGELLIEGEERNPGLSWPLAIDRWLEQCLEQARAAGVATSRKELAAALMTVHEYGEDELAALLRDYRRRTVGDLLAAGAGGEVIRFRKQGPGPRARRARGR